MAQVGYHLGTVRPILLCVTLPKISCDKLLILSSVSLFRSEIRASITFKFSKHDFVPFLYFKPGILWGNLTDLHKLSSKASNEGISG